jgi:UDP-N-acetylglucosamine--N-acetylmuramyl-(pentapeptide) pyrophosphoryl-undecaprenol N-acetylglucosamine transferase
VQKSEPTFVFAGGGTGGHLFPALAIAEEVRKKLPKARIVFVGTNDKIEARVVPPSGFEFATIWISGFHRSVRLSNLLFPLKVIVSFVQSFFLLRKLKPLVVVGTGGYVCGPIGLVAAMLGIPLVLHESNSYPGLTTRLLARRASTVFIAFDATRTWISSAREMQTIGTPVRALLFLESRNEAFRYFTMNPARRTLLVVGGSLGASSINNAVAAIVRELESMNIQLIWQTGLADYERLATLSKSSSIWIGAFVDRMELAYAAADLVVSRAGATTIAELTALGKPAILVPYPYAAADHQTINATTLVEKGAAVMIRDGELNRSLKHNIIELLNDEKKRNHMSTASKSLGKPDASARIASRILELAS